MDLIENPLFPLRWRHRRHREQRHLPCDPRLRRLAHRPRRARLPHPARLPHGAWGRNYLYNVSLDPTARFLDSVSVFTSLNRKSLYTPAFLENLSNGVFAASLFQELDGKVKTNEPLDRLLYTDSKTYLPGDILTKVDRMSMAASLETRAPLLDHKLIEFVMTVPASLKLAAEAAVAGKA